jgi:hypothetical protein
LLGVAVNEPTPQEKKDITALLDIADPDVVSGDTETGALTRQLFSQALSPLTPLQNDNPVIDFAVATLEANFAGSNAVGGDAPPPQTTGQATRTFFPTVEGFITRVAAVGKTVKKNFVVTAGTAGDISGGSQALADAIAKGIQPPSTSTVGEELSKAWSSSLDPDTGAETGFTGLKDLSIIMAFAEPIMTVFFPQEEYGPACYKNPLNPTWVSAKPSPDVAQKTCPDPTYPESDGALLCYKSCPTGYPVGVGPVCWSACASGSWCFRSGKGRGVGKPRGCPDGTKSSGWLGGCYPTVQGSTTTCPNNGIRMYKWCYQPGGACNQDDKLGEEFGYSCGPFCTRDWRSCLHIGMDRRKRA